MNKNFKIKLILPICVTVFALSITHTSNAKSWKDLKNKLKGEKKQIVNEAERELEQQIKTPSTNRQQTTHSAGSTSGSSNHSGSQPNPDLRQNVLKCDDVALSNVQIPKATCTKTSNNRRDDLLCTAVWRFRVVKNTQIANANII